MILQYTLIEYFDKFMKYSKLKQPKNDEIIKNRIKRYQKPLGLSQQRQGKRLEYQEQELSTLKQ